MELLKDIAIRQAAIQLCKKLYTEHTKKSWRKRAIANVRQLSLPRKYRYELLETVEQTYIDLKLPDLLYKAAEEIGRGGEVYYKKLLIDFWPYFSTKDRERNLSNLVYRAAEEIKNGGESYSKKLLIDFWLYVPIEDRDGIINDFFDGKKLVSELLRVDDKESLTYILQNVTETVREKFIFTGSGQDVAVQLAYKDKLESLEFLIRQCLSSEEKIDEFKKGFLRKWPGSGIYINLIRKGKFDAVDKLIDWCFSSKEEIRDLKKELAYKSGGRVCHDLIVCGQEEIKWCEEEEKWELVKMFLAWSFSSEKEIDKFKREVILPKVAEDICLTLIFKDKCEKKWELAETFLKWCSFPKEEEINRFREQLMCSDGVELHLYDLIYEDEMESIEESWKEIELLIRWCLRSKNLYAI